MTQCSGWFWYCRGKRPKKFAVTAGDLTLLASVATARQKRQTSLPLLDSPCTLFASAHAHDGAVHVDVFAAGHFGVESGAHFKEARDAAPCADGAEIGRAHV